MAEKLTREEIKKLKAVSDDPELWHALCNAITHKRGGKYPPDWYEVVVVGKINKG